MSPQLHDVGEFGLIDAVTSGLAPLPTGWLGPGDDAAVVPAPDGRMVVTTDVLVERQHFRRDWSSALDVGHKAAAQNLADIAAMGAVPTALVVGFGAPPDLDASWAIDLHAALAEEAERAGAVVVGGDVVRADEIVVAVTAMGSLEGREPLTRAGGLPGDVLALSAPTGASAAGLAVLRRGFTAPRAAVAAHRRPTPDYNQGPIAALGGAHALIDISDGLVADLRHVASASGLAIDIRSADLPIPDPVVAVSAALGGSDPLEMVLAGGEDHVLAGLFATVDDVPSGWHVIGSSAVGSGVTVDGNEYALGGHVHF